MVGLLICADRATEGGKTTNASRNQNLHGVGHEIERIGKEIEIRRGKNSTIEIFCS